MATFGGVALTSAGGDGDAIMWKVNAEGTTRWAVRGGGTGDDRLRGVAVDGEGAVKAAGCFSSSPATFGGVVLTTAAGDDPLLWKVSAEGTTLLAVRGGGGNHDYLKGVAVDGAGAVLSAGMFHSIMATFGGVAMSGDGGAPVVWKVSGLLRRLLACCTCSILIDMILESSNLFHISFEWPPHRLPPLTTSHAYPSSTSLFALPPSISLFLVLVTISQCVLLPQIVNASNQSSSSPPPLPPSRPPPPRPPAPLSPQPTPSPPPSPPPMSPSPPSPPSPPVVEEASSSTPHDGGAYHTIILVQIVFLILCMLLY